MTSLGVHLKMRKWIEQQRPDYLHYDTAFVIVLMDFLLTYSV